MACGLACPPRARSFGSSFTPRYGVKITATNHEATSAIATTQKIPPAYSPTEELAKPMGRKPAAVTSVPVSIGKAVEVQAKAAVRMRSQPCSIFTTIISTAMMASSTRSPRAMMRAPRVEIDPENRHGHEGDREHERHGEGDHDAGAPSERQELTTSTMASASAKERRNSKMPFVLAQVSECVAYCEPQRGV